MKAWILVLYCCVGSTTREFPLSADVIVALFSMSLVCMDRGVLCSRRVVGLVYVSFLSLSFMSWSETCFLWWFLSVMGSMLIAVSAYKARLVGQCLFLWCRLYLGPLFGRTSSFLEKVMSVLFITLGKMGWGSLGVIVCC